MASTPPIGSVPLGELPHRILMEVSGMVSDVGAALLVDPPDLRVAMDAMLSSPRTPFLGAFLVVIALCIMAMERA